MPTKEGEAVTFRDRADADQTVHVSLWKSSDNSSFPKRIVKEEMQPSLDKSCCKPDSRTLDPEMFTPKALCVGLRPTPHARK